jgi:hypothetical protein
MRLQSHLRLLTLATLAWLAFWLAGLPHYYQQYSSAAMIAFCIALLPAVVWLGLRVIGHRRTENRRTFAVWLAFYFTVPLAVFDYLYCGWYLGQGWRFLAGYWYLSVYYVIPWLVFVPIGIWLGRPQNAGEVGTQGLFYGQKRRGQ